MAAEHNLANALQVVGTYGWHIFPGIRFSDGRHLIPKGLKWSQQSSNDPAQIQQWAAQYPGCYFCIDFAKSGYSAVDIDVKHGQNGFKTLDAYRVAAMELSPTLLVDTPTDGCHAFYRGNLANTTKTALGDGLDTKGPGGMVPLPNQTVPGKGTYRARNMGTPIPDVPRWVSRIVSTANMVKHEARADSAIEELDQTKDLNRASLYLAYDAPIGGPGQHNDALYKVACTVRDLGVSEEMATGMIGAYWNPRILTPRDEGELEFTVHNAYTFSRDKAGNSSTNVLGGMGAVEDYAPEHNPHLDCKPLSDSEFDQFYHRVSDDYGEDATIPQRKWLIDGVAAEGFTTVLVAPGGVGKTTYGLQLAAAAARGDGEFVGVDVTGGEGVPTWIYNGEDPQDELRRRIAGVVQEFELHDLKRGGAKSRNLIYSSGVERPISVMGCDSRTGRTNIKPDAQAMEDFIVRHGIKLVVLDPFVSIHDVDEQGNKAVDDVIKRVFSRIASKTGCAFIIIHHTRKGALAGDMDSARGASSLLAAARVGITLSVMDEAEATRLGVPDTQRRWFVRLDDAKQNMAPPAEGAKWFKRRSVRIANGDSVGVLARVDLELIAEQTRNTMEVQPQDVILMNKVMDQMGPDKVRPLGVVAIEVAKRDPILYGGISPNKFKRQVAALFQGGRTRDGLHISYVVDPDMISTDGVSRGRTTDQWLIGRATAEKTDTVFSEPVQGSEVT